MCYVFFFFFNQKTAYEMRISDWSSDVCSSDLDRRRHRRIAQAQLSSLELGTRLCNIRLRRSETRHSGVIFLLAYCLARDQPLIPIHVLLGICRCGTSPRERRLDRVQTGTQLPGVDRNQRLSRSNVGTFFVKASLEHTINTGHHLSYSNC